MTKTSVKNFATLATGIALQACSNSSFNSARPASAAPDLSNTPSALYSTMSISTPNYADGISPADVTLRLMNSTGMPLSGITMNLTVAGTGNIITACTASDVNGTSKCRIYSTVAETKWATARGQIQLAQQVNFARNTDPATLMAIVTSTGSTTGSNGQIVKAASGIIQNPVALQNSSAVVVVKSSILGLVNQ